MKTSSHAQLSAPFYDPLRSYEENYELGPFGAFADKVKWQPSSPPSFRFLGIPLHTRLGIPAGPLLNGKFIKAALEKGFSAVVYKTVRSRTYPVHQVPNVLAVQVDGDLTLEKAKLPLIANTEYTQPLSITNSFGVPSKDPVTWTRDLKQVVKQTPVGQLVIGSFQGTLGSGSVDDFIADWVETAKLVAKTGVKVMELNVSCPNEGTSHLLCFDIERTVAIVKAVRAVVSVPLIIKIAYFEDQEALRKLVTQLGESVDAISAINTIPAQIVDAEGQQALPGKGRLVSGVCGSAIRWAGLEMVERLSRLKQELGLKYEIVGVGGVMTAGDVKAYLQAGANLVMTATGAMWNPHLAQEAYQELETAKEPK